MRQRRSGRTGMRALAATAAVALSVAGLTACSPGGAGSEGSPEDVDAALEAGGEITVWAWEPPVQQVADRFMELHPNVTVNVVNAGTNTEEYTKLQNAIKAGSGAPDIAQIEYYALPQFELSDALVDLRQFGFDEFEQDYTPSTWSSSVTDEGVWALPQDSGPMVMYYNQATFDRLGIDTVPATWDEYYETAKRIREADPNTYITNDSGDAGLVTSLIWQAGGRPFAYDGENVTVNLQDEGSRKFAENWNRLVQEDLVATDIVGWSDDWYSSLADGSLATLISGAWMPANFESGVEGASGDWRVAPIPTYDGSPVSSENGGSANAILEQSQNKALAAAFLEFMNHEPEGVQIRIDAGSFPATVADLESEEFLGAESEYFGGQQINEVLVDASRNVPTGWQYLPYQVQAISVFKDSVGQAYLNGTDLNEGLKQWQAQLVQYGQEQGFQISES